MLMNEVTIFRPNSRSKEATITSPNLNPVLDALEERMGSEVANRTRKAFKAMKTNGIEFVQFRHGDQRIRVKSVDV